MKRRARNPAAEYRDPAARRKSMTVTLDHSIGSLRMLSVHHEGSSNNDRCNGVAPDMVDMPTIEGMRYRVTFELIEPSKTVKPRANPWRNRPKDPTRREENADTAARTAFYRGLQQVFRDEKRRSKP